MDAFDMCQIVVDHMKIEELYHEFYSSEGLSVGLNVLKAEVTDSQISHT